jgi:peptidoglycan/xylan/chitin deacetylase (PgdA/CDA1 family)
MTPPSARDGGAPATALMAGGVAVAAFAYHEVTDDPRDSGFQRAAALPYKHTRRVFAEHLDGIAAAPVRPSLVVDADLRRPGRYLLLTFDDGGRSAIDIGEELCRRGWRGHFFVTTSLIGSRGFLDATGIRHLRACGHLVGSHSHTHPDIFRELPTARMLEEWRVSGEALAALLGEPCIAASVPGGDISAAVLESAHEAGLRYLFTSEPSLQPRPVGDCWVLGRFCPKVSASPELVRELARFRGWRRALALRRAKDLVRRALPAVYRWRVARTTRPATSESQASRG